MRYSLKLLLSLLLIFSGTQICAYGQPSQAKSKPKAKSQTKTQPQSRPAPTQPGSDNDSLNLRDLNIEIGAGKKEFLPLEPILLTVKLQSRSGQVLLAKEEKRVINARINMVLRNKSTQRQVDSSPLMVALENVVGGEAEIKLRYLLIEGLTDFLIKPGRYQIEVNFESTRKGIKPIQAQLLEIQIVEPRGIDEEAFNFIKSAGSLNNLLQGSGASESADTDATLRGFVAHFRTSGYGDYFAFQLAAHCFQRGELSMAKGLLQELAIKSDFGYAEDVVGMMALISAQLGQRNLVESYLQRLRSDFPQSTYIEKLTEMLAGEQ